MHRSHRKFYIFRKLIFIFRIIWHEDIQLIELNYINFGNIPRPRSSGKWRRKFAVFELFWFVDHEGEIIREQYVDFGYECFHSNNGPELWRTWLMSISEANVSFLWHEARVVDLHFRWADRRTVYQIGFSEIRASLFDVYSQFILKFDVKSSIVFRLYLTLLATSCITVTSSLSRYLFWWYTRSPCFSGSDILLEK